MLLREVDVYRRCLPQLRTTVRGVGWEDNHWAELFRLLGLRLSGAGSVSKESVTLAHFLDKADVLLANVEQIRALDAQVGSVRFRGRRGPQPLPISWAVCCNIMRRL